MIRRARSAVYPYTTLFRSSYDGGLAEFDSAWAAAVDEVIVSYLDSMKRYSCPSSRLFSPEGPERAECTQGAEDREDNGRCSVFRSEEHTSELQSRENLVCR